MRVAVTGATGNLGLAATVMAVQAGHQVRGFVRDPAAFQARSPEERVELRTGDILDRAAVASALDGVEAVIHCVGFSPGEFNRHWDAARHVLEGLGSRGQLIIPAPAAALEPAGATEGGLPGSATGTTSPIGTARLDLEKAVLAAGGTVVHMSAVYGPRVEAGWLAKAIRQALAGKTVWYPGDLDAVVDYLYIEDAARALIAPLARDVARGSRYLAAGPEATTPRRFLSAVFRAVGREPRLRAVPPPCLWVARLLGAEPASPDHPSARWERSAPLEGSQIREALGWMPEVSEAEGIRRTLRWIRQRSSEAHLTGRPGAPPESPTRPGEDNGDTLDAGTDRPDDSWKRFAPPAE